MPDVSTNRRAISLEQSEIKTNNGESKIYLLARKLITKEIIKAVNMSIFYKGLTLNGGKNKDTTTVSSFS